jgi:WD40 repeat protein
MKFRYKRILIVTALAAVCASSYILYYHFLRQPSRPVSGSATLFRTLMGHSSGVEAVDFNPTGETLASGSIDGTARIWRLNE